MSRGRRVSPGEKLLIVADAVLTDARTAATKWDVAQTSVWQWAEEAGGLQALRETYKAREQLWHNQPNAVMVREFERRVHRFSDAHLVRLMIKLFDEQGRILEEYRWPRHSQRGRPRRGASRVRRRG